MPDNRNVMVLGAGWQLVQARNGESHSLDMLDENLVVKNNDVDDILSLLALHPPRDLSRQSMVRRA